MKKEIYKYEITILKEIRVGLILGTIYGLMLGFFASFKFLDSDPSLSLIIGLSICCSILLASIIGSFTPLVLKRLNIDPVIAPGPFVTTSISVLGILIYFTIANTLLNL